MILSITLDDKDGTPVVLSGATGPAALVAASGLIGVSTLRDSRRVRPQGHGGIDETRWEDGRVISLTLEVAGSTPEDAYAQFRAVTAPMLDTLDHGPALLRWTEGLTGNHLQRLVRLADAVDPPIQDNAARFSFSAQFYAEDPRAYAQSLTTVTGPGLSSGGGFTFHRTLPATFDAGAGGTAAVNNAGNRTAPLVLRVYGYALNPVVTLVGSGKKISLAGTIAAGDYVELDTQARTLTLNGLSPVSEMLDSANTQWFEVPRSASTLQLTAGAFDGVTRCDVLFRNAYA